MNDVGTICRFIDSSVTAEWHNSSLATQGTIPQVRPQLMIPTTKQQDVQSD